LEVSPVVLTLNVAFFKSSSTQFMVEIPPLEENSSGFFPKPSYFPKSTCKEIVRCDVENFHTQFIQLRRGSLFFVGENRGCEVVGGKEVSILDLPLQGESIVLLVWIEIDHKGPPKGGGEKPSP
jgi:hypothetical protein